ncbi:hypothetical protein I7I50_00680 [Histoplasma capsulatum G186AR]|uniref:Uncharacterized protein n=1 Tax=Ajellomyces capsulatus TaxID=5037 RepID=A0A8H7YGP9_AJECA|nr:hypothetical protein I7I52_07948 [Histoplasma capsulatum]QSS72744.1 hypothetical protein I7I50_00680 [Histoplasma capsulatum G186AR]
MSSSINFLKFRDREKPPRHVAETPWIKANKRAKRRNENTRKVRNTGETCRMALSGIGIILTCVDTTR